jgi:hypothetical protein
MNGAYIRQVGGMLKEFFQRLLHTFFAYAFKTALKNSVKSGKLFFIETVDPYGAQKGLRIGMGFTESGSKGRAIGIFKEKFMRPDYFEEGMPDAATLNGFSVKKEM